MEFSRQEYWSGLPFPPPEDLPSPGTEASSIASPASPAGEFFTTGPVSLDKMNIMWKVLDVMDNYVVIKTSAFQVKTPDSRCY